DRRRKLPVTTLLRALDSSVTAAARAKAEANDTALDPMLVQGMSNEEILGSFYNRITYKKDKKGWKTAFDGNRLRGVKLAYDLIDASTGRVKVAAGEKITPRAARKLAEDGLKEILVQDDQLLGQFLAIDLIDPKTGLVYQQAGEE